MKRIMFYAGLALTLIIAVPVYLLLALYRAIEKDENDETEDCC